MFDWTSGTADASAAERASAYLIARIPGSPDVLKEIAVADMVFKDASGNVGIGTSSPTQRLSVGGNFVTTGEIALSGSDFVYSWAGGTTGQRRAGIYLDGSSQVVRFFTAQNEVARMNASEVRPGTDNAFNLGSGSFRWSTVYAGTGTINTSDEREKCDLGNIPDQWLDAWGDVEWARFKFNGGKRWHIGLVAQQVHAAFAKHGLDAFEIGLCCFDRWEDQSEPVFETVERTRKVPRLEIVKVEGTPDDDPLFKPMIVEVEESYSETIDTGETRIVQQAGDRWGLRYDECQAIEAAWQRREFARLRAEISALKGES